MALLLQLFTKCDNKCKSVSFRIYNRSIYRVVDKDTEIKVITLLSNEAYIPVVVVKFNLIYIYI